MKQKSLKKRTRILSAFLAALALTFGLCACRQNDPIISDKEKGKFSELALIDQFFQKYSLFELDEAEIMKAVLKGYVAGTGDRYAEYFTAEEYDRLTSESQGESVGVGINVIQNTEKNAIEIISVLPDSPASEADLRPGDCITFIKTEQGYQSVAETGYTKSLELLRGAEGSVAEFSVERGDQKFDFSLVRRQVISLSVQGRVCATDPGVGIVKITEFNLTTPTQFREAVESLLQQGCDRFVFDVRYNPGGDLNSIKAVLACFLSQGDVVIRTSDRKGNKTSDTIHPENFSGDYAGCSIKKENIGIYKSLPLAVLTNGSTASAAELFTSVLRDYGLSITVGTKTYGKGTMQSTFRLKQYGYDGAIKLTTKYYYPPLSDSYDGVGILPDVEVDLAESLKNVNIYKISDAEDNQLQAAIQALGQKNK